MANIDTDMLQRLAEALTAAPRLQDGAALAGNGLLQPLASLRTRSARRELARVRAFDGPESDAAQREAALVSALATRERDIGEQFARQAGPQAAATEKEAALSGRITRDGGPLVDVEVVVLDEKLQGRGRTCSNRDGRYALAVPADMDLRFEVREDRKPRFRDKQPTAYPAGYRGTRDIEIGQADPVCDPVPPPDPQTDLLQMPELVGLPLERATRAVEALGLRVGKVSEKPSDAAGLVLAQKPEAGTRVAPGTQVALTLGRKDQRSGTVPIDLKGKTLNDALALMAEQQVSLASVTVVAGRGQTPFVRSARPAENGEALHLDVAAGGGKASEIEIAGTLIGASPEGLEIGLDSAAEAARWLTEAKVLSLADLHEAASEDDAALRKRFGLDTRAKVAAVRRALGAAAGRMTRA